MRQRTRQVLKYFSHSRYPRETFPLLNKTSSSVSDATSTVHVRLIAPNFVTYNSTATLHCNHSVSDAELHKVEFMKDDKKILQYIKDRKPPFVELKVDGANMEILEPRRFVEKSPILENMSKYNIKKTAGKFSSVVRFSNNALQYFSPGDSSVGILGFLLSPDFMSLISR
ncbi:hypothetical protein K0M31_002764 [Melipona bicolor]|uniref:Uncharacterized protein n=1 Tax=Melipona bicolor TaxID=60889 RepID=A0AA40KPX2_9HYME|nr:hypothetical protein K0M31_002764 [Melipona bicolor]